MKCRLHIVFTLNTFFFLNLFRDNKMINCSLFLFKSFLTTSCLDDGGAFSQKLEIKLLLSQAPLTHSL